VRKHLAILASVAAAGLAVKLNLALGPRWQEVLVLALALAFVLTALAAFAEVEAWPAFSGVFASLVVYDVSLLVRPPLPGSLVVMYTTMGVCGAVLYLSVSEAAFRGLVEGFQGLYRHPRLKRHRPLILALGPLGAGAVALAKSFPELTPPLELRIVHPEPPTEIAVKGKAFDMVGGTNPLRKVKAQDPARFAKLVEEGKAVYYRNCFYCHGDNLDGKGHFAAGLNPLPANFQDIGTIAMLQESFVYWRVAKGGPGLPKSGHPWSSAMPVWEDMLTEDELWKAVLFIYEGTGREPRTFAPHGGGEGGHE